MGRAESLVKIKMDRLAHLAIMYRRFIGGSTSFQDFLVCLMGLSETDRASFEKVITVSPTAPQLLCPLCASAVGAFAAIFAEGDSDTHIRGVNRIQRKWRRASVKLKGYKTGKAGGTTACEISSAFTICTTKSDSKKNLLNGLHRLLRRHEISA